MSELKARTARSIADEEEMLELGADCPIEPAQVYLKSEADKVIAEKDKVIAEQKDKLQNVSELLKETREWLIESQKLHKRCADNAIKTIRHQKYKRCLAMAKWCEIGAQFQNNIVMQFDNPFYIKRAEWLEKWHKRWLKIADKFKEAHDAEA